MRSITPLNRPPPLHVSVQESLRAFIDDNKLKAGDPLPPETFLAQQLGVSRNSVREAIRSLESIGILETRRGIGIFVAAFSFKPLLDNLAYGMQDSLRDVEELRLIRAVLESGLIDRTIEVISADDLAALRDVTEAMRRRAERHEAFAAEDQQFHQLLFRCQNNRMLSGLIDVFWIAFNKASNFADLKNLSPLDTWRDHHAIVEAVAARDVEAARARLNDHYQGIKTILANNRPTRTKRRNP